MAQTPSQPIVFLAIAALCVVAALPPWQQVGDSDTGDHLRAYHYLGFHPFNSAPAITAGLDAFPKQWVEMDLLMLAAESGSIVILASGFLWSMAKKEER